MGYYKPSYLKKKPATMRAFLCGSGSTAAMATHSYCARVVEKLGAGATWRLLWGGATPISMDSHMLHVWYIYRQLGDF